VVRRWLNIYCPRTLDFSDATTVQVFVDKLLEDKEKVAGYRWRLQDLGWFMKSLKEPLARLANKSDGVKGAFWASRYKSIAVLDDEALLATCAYIDLNPVAAGISDLPETSEHTSIRQRVEHAASKDALEHLKAAAFGSVAGCLGANAIEQDHWLCPLGDRRALLASKGLRQPNAREGMLDGYSLGSYLLLVDYTSRLCRDGKASLSADVAPIFERLGTNSDTWAQQMRQLLSPARLVGNYFTTQPNRLQAIANKRGLHHLQNLVS